MLGRVNIAVIYENDAIQLKFEICHPLELNPISVANHQPSFVEIFKNELSHSPLNLQEMFIPGGHECIIFKDSNNASYQAEFFTLNLPDKNIFHADHMLNKLAKCLEEYSGVASSVSDKEYFNHATLSVQGYDGVLESDLLALPCCASNEDTLQRVVHRIILLSPADAKFDKYLEIKSELQKQLDYAISHKLSLAKCMEVDKCAEILFANEEADAEIYPPRYTAIICKDGEFDFKQSKCVESRQALQQEYERCKEKYHAVEDAAKETTTGFLGLVGLFKTAVGQCKHGRSVEITYTEVTGQLNP